MKRKISVITAVMIAVVSVLCTFIFTVHLISRNTGAVTQKTAMLEKLLDAYFIDEYDKEQLADAAAAAMIRATGDPWSYYVPASEYAAYMDSSDNSFIGIGITILDAGDEQGFRVTAVTGDGPADKAGIMVGDILHEVEGKRTKELGMDGTKQHILGEKGTAVQLKVYRQGEILDLSVTRQYVQEQVVRAELLEDKIGYIKITNFGNFSSSQVIDAIAELQTAGANAFVFDVRFNPGGQKDQLVSILDHLLPEGVLFRSLDYKGREEISRSDAACVDMPMAVLVNGESYSAAEFFAAALQEYEWAAVVGEKTTGKGNYQNFFTLADGSGVGLSIGKYFTPKGVALTDVGVTPDNEISLSQEDLAALYYRALPYTEDEQLQEALTEVRNMLFAESS